MALIKSEDNMSDETHSTYAANRGSGPSSGEELCKRSQDLCHYQHSRSERIISATILVPGQNQTAVAEIITALERTLGTVQAASALLRVTELAVSVPTTVAAVTTAPLPQSALHTLLLLKQVDSVTGAAAAIIGRSYDGHPWVGMLCLASSAVPTLRPGSRG